VQRVVNDGAEGRVGETERPSSPRRILLDPGETEAVKSVPPKGTGVRLGAELLGDLLVLGSVGGA
jgi:hypothetical protein